MFEAEAAQQEGRVAKVIGHASVGFVHGESIYVETKKRLQNCKFIRTRERRAAIIEQRQNFN